MTKAEKLAQKIAYLTDINAHNEAAIYLASEYGTERERMILNGIKEKADDRGYGDSLELSMRYYIVNAIVARQKPLARTVLHNAF